MHFGMYKYAVSGVSIGTFVRKILKTKRRTAFFRGKLVFLREKGQVSENSEWVSGNSH